MKTKPLQILLRYFILLLLSLGNLYLFYLIFTPITFYISYGALSILLNSITLNYPSLIIQGVTITLIPACIAGSAYYLLTALNLSTPMTSKTRLKSLAFLISAFLIFNIARIVTFSILFINGFAYFDLAHKAFWYFGSTALVILIWFSNVKIFNIKSIPVYTDWKSIHKWSQK